MANDFFADYPLAYHITFTCYGTRLHGSEAGSVDRHHNMPYTPQLPHSPDRCRFERAEMTQPPYKLDASARKLVMDAIIEVCAFRTWELLAAHVLEKHVHIVVQASAPPEKVMHDFKAYASRKLNRTGLEKPDTKRWTRHGSTRYKWTTEEVAEAVDYAVRRQGPMMEVYERK